MKPFCSPAGQPVIERIARERTLLVFDFDGTLAPIVDRREDARMRRETRALLRATALLYPCAVVSGRARPDLTERLEGVPLIAVVGNHGAEPGAGPVERGLERQVRRYVAALNLSLGDVPGIEIEDKRFSVAVHYRSAASWRDAEARVIGCATALTDARVFVGRAVVNVLPADAPTKADAVRALCEREQMRLPVYVGDDRSDEEAFRSGVVGISVRVGDSRESAAGWFISDQVQIDEVLRRLIAARARHDGLGERWEGLVRVLGL